MTSSSVVLSVGQLLTVVGVGDVSRSSSKACARCADAPMLSAVSTASCQSTVLRRCAASTEFVLH